MVTKQTCNNETYKELSRKWTLPIIKCLFYGCKKFNHFLDYNPELTNKVLSEQLKRLEEFGFIKKVIISTTPLKAEYELTQMGLDLNKIIYEKIIWAEKYGLITRNHPHFGGREIEEIFNIY